MTPNLIPGKLYIVKDNAKYRWYFTSKNNILYRTTEIFRPNMAINSMIYLGMHHFDRISFLYKSKIYLMYIPIISNFKDDWMLVV